MNDGNEDACSGMCKLGFGGLRLGREGWHFLFFFNRFLTPTIEVVSQTVRTRLLRLVPKPCWRCTHPPDNRPALDCIAFLALSVCGGVSLATRMQ